ncbi:restriction endonuclease subunit S [Lactobacillus sp. ESL0703]|uniref:restriction endonuclease subunit S n=1 Tax=Lactobacillus sp. ESL0703 TaxID=2983218 RepID=UPI0023F6B6B4|nr:restriction endonuclease subunit S [Lactobacillus sp. ESL0703]MDF7668116.1 restriction endonuclease subunit S [Lactobacillus sp. ESL0703]
MSKDTNVPRIRFKGFTNAWERDELGDVAEIKTGASDLQDADSNGKYPFFVRSKKVERSNKYLFDGEAILIPGEGKLGEIYHYYVGKFDYHQRVYKISNFKLNGKYVLYYMQKNFKRHALKYTVKATVDSLRLPTITKFQIFSPTNEEQTKISLILDRITMLLTLQERKFELYKQIKKYLLQKMFANKHEILPQVRFNGFTENWKSVQLGKIVNVKDGTHESPKYYKTGFPLVTSKNLTSKGLDLSDVSLISKEDFDSINQRSKIAIGDIIFGMIGTIGTPVLLNQDGFAIKNVALLKKSNKISNTFLIQLLKSPVFNKYLHIENAGGTQKFLSLNKIRNFKFQCTIHDEQQKMGSFFLYFDNLIITQERKKKAYINLKQYLLQNLFC